MNTSKPADTSPSLRPLILPGRARDFEINETKPRIGNPGKVCGWPHLRISTMDPRIHANEAKNARTGKSLRIMTTGDASESLKIGWMYACWRRGSGNTAETEQTKPRMRRLGKICGQSLGRASSGLRIGANEAKDGQNTMSLMIVSKRKNLVIGWLCSIQSGGPRDASEREPIPFVDCNRPSGPILRECTHCSGATGGRRPWCGGHRDIRLVARRGQGRGVISGRPARSAACLTRPVGAIRMDAWPSPALPARHACLPSI
jgi:hypothetical protein